MVDLLVAEGRKRTWLTDRPLGKALAVGEHDGGEHLVARPDSRRRISMAWVGLAGLPMIPPSSSRVVSAASSSCGGRPRQCMRWMPPSALARATRWT